MRRKFVNGRKERRKKRHKKQEEKSMIGKIVDLSLEDFEKELIEQKVNIGTINNLILHLESIYFDFRTRKDAILKMKFEQKIEEAEAQNAINGLYAEMIKIEQKITYLKQRSKELVNVDTKTPN